MGFHVQLDLKAIEQAAIVAGAGGITLHQQLAGLAQLYHHVFTRKSDRATPELLMGCFGVSRAQLERLVEAEIAFGHLAELAGETSAWRIRGAKRYLRLKQALSDGGKKSKGNLKQFQRGEAAGTPRVPAVPPATPESRSGASAGEPPAKSRGLSDQEEYWGVLESLRVEHCTQLGLEPGESKRPKHCNTMMLKAVEAVGIVDDISSGKLFSRWDLLTLLFERYLQQDRIGVKDRENNPCVPPWPIALFLSAGVLSRFKTDYDEEQAA